MIDPIRPINIFPVRGNITPCCLSFVRRGRLFCAPGSLVAGTCFDVTDSWISIGVLTGTCDPPAACAPPPPAAYFELRALRIAEQALRRLCAPTEQDEGTLRPLRLWPFRWPVQAGPTPLVENPEPKPPQQHLDLLF